MEDPEPWISSEADLVERVGGSGHHPIEDWLRNHIEFVDDFDDAGDTEEFRLLLFHVGYSGSHEYYYIVLPYPFPFSAFEEEADRAECKFRSIIHASSLADPAAALGYPRSDDLMTEFAEGYLGGVSRDQIAEVLGGRWRRLDSNVRQGADGDDIHAWFRPSDGRQVALGLGSESIYVAKLQRGAQGQTSIDDSPEPTVPLWWTGPWQEGVPQDDPAVTLEYLRQALARCGAR